MIKCAKCGREMQQVNAGNTVIDVCTACGGVWFDMGELVEAARLGKGDQEQLAECLLAEADREGGWGQDPAFCPRCAAALVPQRFDKDLPVILDFCPQEHGVWLDQGEFAEINRFFDKLYNKLFPGRKDLTREEARVQVESNERLLDAMDIVAKVGCAAIATAGAYLVNDAVNSNPYHTLHDHMMVNDMFFSPGAVSYGTTHIRKKRLKWSS
jgi:uncharacterized protein